MKKLSTLLLSLSLLGVFNFAQAIETNVSGSASSPLTKKIEKSASLKGAVVSDTQEQALKNALKILIDRTLGVNASKNPEVMEKFEDLYSQIDVFVIDKEFSAETKNDTYISKAMITVDETAFRNLVSDLGIALNTQKVRSNSIIVVMDEFFAQPSNLKEAVLKEEVTTYKYDYDEKLKDKETASSSSYAKSSAKGAKSSSSKVDAKAKGNYSANVRGGYADSTGAAGVSASARGSYNASYKGNAASSSSYNKSASSGSKSNYGHFIDYGKNEHEFFQNVKKYDVSKPTAENLNYTQPALVDAFVEYDIKSIDNDMFKSKFFKGSYVTADKLQDSEILAQYVDFARNTAKADFFAIGVSYITDNGINDNTGKNNCDGNVFLKIYSTLDGEVIASGTLTETASGNTADQARLNVASKIGNELGETLAKKIQDYWKKRLMYGSEYIVEVKGNFLPIERIQINEAIKGTQGVSALSQKNNDSTAVEYSLNYKGEDNVADLIFLNLTKSGLGSKFNKYDYKVKSNRIIFMPLGTKQENL